MGAMRIQPNVSKLKHKQTVVFRCQSYLHHSNLIKNKQRKSPLFNLQCSLPHRLNSIKVILNCLLLSYRDVI